MPCVLRAISRDQLDIDGVHEMLAASLVGASMDTAAPFTLTRDWLIAATCAGKSAHQLLVMIAAAKQLPLHRVFAAWTSRNRSGDVASDRAAGRCRPFRRATQMPSSRDLPRA